MRAGGAALSVDNVNSPFGSRRDGDDAILVATAIAVVKCFVSIQKAIDSAGDWHSVGAASDKKTIVRRARFKGAPTAIKIRLLQIGAIVFWAKRVAIAAVIAVVGEVRDLIGLFKYEFSLVADGHDAAVWPDFDVAVRQPQFTGVVSEVGIVRANGNAFIAGDAIERDEMRVDFFRYRRDFARRW